MHWDILDVERRKLLPHLEGFRRQLHAYLAGGTALALQIGHRTSLDFDFYTQHPFDLMDPIHALGNTVKPTMTHSAPNTLIMRVKNVEISIFLYEYDLLKAPVKTDHLDLASKEDIAAMKMIAITQRGTMRDFVDMYFLLKEFQLGEVFRFTKKKFPPFDPYIGLRALTYFKDADEEKGQTRFTLRQAVRWEEVKRTLQREGGYMARKGLQR